MRLPPMAAASAELQMDSKAARLIAPKARQGSTLPGFLLRDQSRRRVREWPISERILAADDFLRLDRVLG